MGTASKLGTMSIEKPLICTETRKCSKQAQKNQLIMPSQDAHQ